MMSDTPTPVESRRRFKINPVEILIFSLVCGGFTFSLYSLFQDADSFQFAALRPMNSRPTDAARRPASLEETSEFKFEIPCQDGAGPSLRGDGCPRAKRVFKLTEAP